MRNIVNALLLSDGRVLLARRSPQRKAYGGTWSFPGGHVEPEETLEEALVREVREEIGVRPTSFVGLETIEDPNTKPDDPVTYHMYVVHSWKEGEPRLLGEEHTELRWFSPEDASNVEGLALEEYRRLLLSLVPESAE